MACRFAMKSTGISAQGEKTGFSPFFKIPIFQETASLKVSKVLLF